MAQARPIYLERQSLHQPSHTPRDSIRGDTKTAPNYNAPPLFAETPIDHTRHEHQRAQTDDTTETQISQRRHRARQIQRISHEITPFRPDTDQSDEV